MSKEHEHLGNLVAIDGSLINAVLSMHWADYREGAKKAKIHLGFDLNRGIPLKLHLTNGKDYWVATNRFDLSAEQIASIYKLRWESENFFAWWKRHLKVYHLIARSEYGLMVQILSGLITYLLLAIYCHQQHNEKVNIKRVRELRIKIQNEARNPEHTNTKNDIFKERDYNRAKT